MDIKIGETYKLFYGDNNINNSVIHIRAFVDDNFVVLRSWSKHKKQWVYDIKHKIWFSIHKKALIKK